MLRMVAKRHVALALTAAWLLVASGSAHAQTLLRWKLKPGETATAEEIIAFCRERLAAFKSPKLVEFRESLPKTIVGKILRRQLVAEDQAKK